MGWLLGLVKFLYSLWQGRKPPLVVEEAQALGATQARLDVEIKANEEVRKSAEAGVLVGGVVASDDGLRRYEASDPNNRDNP